MKLHEYQARDLFESAGIPVPRAEIAETPDEALAAARRVGLPLVVKAQVLTGGRGKAGGVKRADSPEAARDAAEAILAMRIKDLPVRCVLLASAVDVAREFYLGMVVDRTAKAVRCMLSASGGMDIEEVAANHPDRIRNLFINPLDGIDAAALDDALQAVFPDEDAVRQAREIVASVYALMCRTDASLVEINPLALLTDGRLLAIDAKLVLDDNGLPVCPELEALRNPDEHSADELDARTAGLSFVGLDGTIGCMVNGAGLAMATMDLIKLYGREPANFLDVGGSSSPEKVLNAFRILLRNPKLKAILVNIFGGITRCDDIARGLLQAREELKMTVPLVVRLIGTNEKEGRALLTEAGIPAMSRMTEAVKHAVELAEAS